MLVTVYALQLYGRVVYAENVIFLSSNRTQTDFFRVYLDNFVALLNRYCKSIEIRRFGVPELGLGYFKVKDLLRGGKCP